MKMRKKDILATLLNISAVTEDTLRSWANQTQLLMVDGEHTIGNLHVSKLKYVYFAH